MMQYKLPQTVNKARRKRATPKSNQIKNLKTVVITLFYLS